MTKPNIGSVGKGEITMFSSPVTEQARKVDLEVGMWGGGKKLTDTNYQITRNLNNRRAFFVIPLVKISKIQNMG